MPQFADVTSAAQRELFKKIIERTRVLSDGIWFGTPHNLGLEWDSAALAARMPEMTHEHLILFGKMDYWIPRDHMDVMVDKLPCPSRSVPLRRALDEPEQPLLFARVFGDQFRGSSAGA